MVVAAQAHTKTALLAAEVTVEDCCAAFIA
jgi:hypothetical protein